MSVTSPNNKYKIVYRAKNMCVTYFCTWYNFPIPNNICTIFEVMLYWLASPCRCVKMYDFYGGVMRCVAGLYVMIIEVCL